MRERTWLMVGVAIVLVACARDGASSGQTPDTSSDVHVSAVEYAFEGIPETLPAGETT